MNPYLTQTDKCVTVELPWPPSVNTYWRNITIKGKARTVVSKKGREYQQAVLRRMKTLTMRYTGRLDVTIEASPPDRRKRDLDNILKATLDAVARAGVMVDDSQIDRLAVVRLQPKPKGRVIVKITEIPFMEAA